MIDINENLQHHVQRYILDVLRHTEFARFRDLRPIGLDSNAFSYHLKQLIRYGFIVKAPQGYTLSLQGIAYIDRVSRLDTRPRRQPKIMTITAIYNEYEEVLTYRKTSQPMIGQFTFPAGMLHMEDPTIQDAAIREVSEKMGISLDEVEHVGDCYMVVRYERVPIMNSLMHVFEAKIKKSDITLRQGDEWISALSADTKVLAPATERLLTEIAGRKPDLRFFEEFAFDW